MNSKPSGSTSLYEPAAHSTPIVVAATFEATRAELVDADTLLGSAEVARDVVGRATRVFDVLAVTPARMRRIDGWLGDVGVVTHPASPVDEDRRIGSVCDRSRATELVSMIIEALVVDGLPPAAPAPLDAADIGALSPSTLPAGVSWVVFVSATDVDPSSSSSPSGPDRLVIADAAGLVAAGIATVSEPVQLQPISRLELADRLESMLSARPPTVAELLVEN